MPHSPSMNLPLPAREILLGLAQRVIGEQSREPGMPEPAGHWPMEVHEHRACFVTLTLADGQLRGCRGALDACRPLYADVWRNAWASAFDDPRFAPVTPAESPGLRVEISVLSPLEPLAAVSESHLLELVVPGRDGLVLVHGQNRATFLPKVWEKLPDPRDFLGHLRLKAGLQPDFWSPAIQLWRYRTESFGG